MMIVDAEGRGLVIISATVDETMMACTPALTLRELVLHDNFFNVLIVVHLSCLSRLLNDLLRSLLVYCLGDGTRLPHGPLGI
jgi:hypothetical protein